MQILPLRRRFDPLRNIYLQQEGYYMAILHITSENFETEVLNSSVPTLVDFWASWCGPCKMLAPVLETVDAEVASFAKVCKLNVDDEPPIAARYGIMSIPTMIVFKDGKPDGKLVGVRPKEDIVALLKK